MVVQDENTSKSSSSNDLSFASCVGPGIMPGDLLLNNAQTINEFRAKVADFTPDEYLNDDGFLIRWLIARDFDLDKASFMLKSYFDWRIDSSIDTILDWKFPQDIRTKCPYEITGPDREGRPILVFPWARWKSWEFTDNDRREEYLKYMNQMLEKCVAAIKPPATQFMILADSDGFSFRHMSRLKALDANLEALRGFEAHYPELMKLAFVVNCPKVFSVLFSVIKPLMSPRTQDKLQIHDFNAKKWGKALRNFVARENLPVQYRMKDDHDQDLLSSFVNNSDEGDKKNGEDNGILLSDTNSIEVQR